MDRGFPFFILLNELPCVIWFGHFHSLITECSSCCKSVFICFSIFFWCLLRSFFNRFYLNVNVCGVNAVWSCFVSVKDLRDSYSSVLLEIIVSISEFDVEWVYLSLHKKCLYLEFFWSVFSLNRSEYGEIQSISPYSVRMRENTEQKNYKYRHFSCSDSSWFSLGNESC